LLNKIKDFFKEIFGLDDDEVMDDPMIFAKKSRDAVKAKERKKRFWKGNKKNKTGDKKTPPQSASKKPSSGKKVPKKEPVKKQAQKKQPQNKKPVKKPAEIKPKWNIKDFHVEKKDDEVRFHDLRLPLGIMHAIHDLGFKYCTPIQAEILPETLTGKDATGRAQTGTGKSAAFLIMMISHLVRKPLSGKRKKGCPRALILAPTRELALQIEQDGNKLGKYSRVNILSVIGGTGFEKQKNNLKNRPIDIVVATPGRLLDFAGKKIIDLRHVEILVIDEADRMLDMGFIPDIKKIVYMTPHKDKLQTLFFSATLTSDVMNLASQWTKDSFTAEIEPDQVASDSVNQLVYLTTREEKFNVLYNVVVKEKLTSVIVFTNRRDQARDLAEKLSIYGVSSALISGELSQSRRSKALNDFKQRKITVLVATDVAARGIHIEGISHVINFNLPQDAEHYVHRIGRTGRAGHTGISISFADEDESFNIPAIEEYIGNKLKCEYPDDSLVQEPDVSEDVISENKKALKKRQFENRKKNGNSRNYRGKKKYSKNKKFTPRSGMRKFRKVDHGKKS